MPIYEYRCRNGHTFEVIQSMAEDPVERCEECEAPVERVFHPVAVHFKGSGFYTTDYARKGSGKGDGKDGGGKDGAKAEKSGGGGSSGDSKKPESGSKGSEKAGKGSGSGD